eukprot:3583087-Pleurochrysis_carterae.AAC.1
MSLAARSARYARAAQPLARVANSRSRSPLRRHGVLFDWREGRGAFWGLGAMEEREGAAGLTAARAVPGSGGGSGNGLGGHAKWDVELDVDQEGRVDTSAW